MPTAPLAVTTARGRGRSSLLVLAFALALAAPFVTLLALPVVVTVDGPAHMGHAAAFWDAVSRPTSIVRQYSSIQLLPATNLLPDLAAGLASLLVGTRLAEKAVVGGILAGLPLATVYAIRGVDPGRWWLGFAAIPLAASFTLFYGFYPFNYGVLGFVLTAGFVVRHRGAWRLRPTIGLAILLTMTYAAHVLPFLLCLAFIGSVAVVDGAVRRARPWAVVRGWVGPLAAAAPAIVLTSILVVRGLTDERSRLVTDGVGSTGVSLKLLLVQLVGVLSLSWGTTTYDAREAAFSGLVAVALLVVTVSVVLQRDRPFRLREADAYLLFGLAVLVPAIVLPENANFGAGGSHLTQRLAPIPVFGLLLWLAAADLRGSSTMIERRARWLLATSAIVASVGLSAVRAPVEAALSRHADSYAAVAACLATDATMIQVNLGRVESGPAGRTDPLTADTGRITAINRGWDLGNIGAALAFFPLRNRPETDPYRYLVIPGGSIEGIPPAIDPAGYRARTPGTVDYVLVYGRALASPETLRSAGWTALDGQLDAGYELVATSSDGLLEAWESRDPDVSARAAQSRRAAGDACGR